MTRAPRLIRVVGSRFTLKAYCWGSFQAAVQAPKRLVYLSVDGQPFQTREGLGLYARRPAVEAAYGKPTATIDNSAAAATMLIYDKKGIAFHLTAGTVTKIIVFWPGTAETIWKF